MHIIVNNTSMVPIYEQIMDQIKAAIVSGELTEDTMLPSVRGLALWSDRTGNPQPV